MEPLQPYSSPRFYIRVCSERDIIGRQFAQLTCSLEKHEENEEESLRQVHRTGEEDWMSEIPCGMRNGASKVFCGEVELVFV